MAGFNGAPDIWQPTKAFLKNELEKEAAEHPGAKVTLLPFQDKALAPVSVDLKNYSWPELEKSLNAYLRHITRTNICDAWLEAEKFIDQSCDNYIVLMTDGQDNVFGPDRLGRVLESFCGKFQNTKGFYIELTEAASLPDGVQNAIDLCKDIYTIPGTGGIPSFGCSSEDVIHINTRDLPAEIPLGFSNSGTFKASLAGNDNQFVSFSIVGDQISGGRITLRAESKLGPNIETLNKAIDAPSTSADVTVQSDDIIITNPRIEIVIHTTPIRSLDIPAGGEKSVSGEVDRVRPFLGRSGTPADTLRWNLSPAFSPAAISDGASALFRIKSDKAIGHMTILYDGKAIGNDSTMVISPEDTGLLELVIPASEADGMVRLELLEVNSVNLDRVNGSRPENASIPLSGEIKTSFSIAEILFWSILGLIVLFLAAWFGFIRDRVYPKFKRGIITVQSPYFATIRASGYRLIVFGPRAKRQSLFDRVWKGEILYHVNQSWPCEAEVAPSGKNMRFRSASGNLLSDPSPLWTRGADYKVIEPGNNSFKIAINIR